ncbi:uncharacterized protein N7500_009865 [Penicillium coprophilum]|uniref:uncharacterized protein n=1 Tax=Penicillium coprophilum TaxID=36646 RepID=UPI0023A25EA9|nr:uncharacterized protein N7500_009865 [Penicillium coprophilum]KAJ5154426.1 hypothetical protein N7500_009865 [Penicillium coprophilum]
MNNRSSQALAPFTPQTKEKFLQFLLENPSTRRVSRHGTESLLEWLTNPLKRPTSQTEFSRRNYVRKTFVWDMDSQKLLAKPKSSEACYRVVVFEDKIADTVESVHESNGHAGWDGTWKSISSSYYGILRSDVIYLLKQCQICAHDPSKRPKRTKASVIDPSSAHEALSSAERGVIERGDTNWDFRACEELAAGQNDGKC